LFEQQRELINYQSHVTCLLKFQLSKLSKFDWAYFHSWNYFLWSRDCFNRGFTVLQAENFIINVTWCGFHNCPNSTFKLHFKSHV